MRFSVDEALVALRAGHMLIVTDDEDRENEGDLVIAGQHADMQAIQFMARHGGGLICVALPGERLDALGLPPAWLQSNALHGTAFTVSVDACTTTSGVTSGISAHDRAATIRVLLDPATRPDDLARPGHVFPLRARPGGVLERRGHTEAAVDLARLAGLIPAGVICEILGEGGGMARGAELEVFAARWGLGMISVAQLVDYVQQQVVVPSAEAELPTQYARFRLRGYREPRTGQEHVALVLGDPATRDEAGHNVGTPPLVRIHSECLTGDSFGSLRCDCGAQLDAALTAIAAEGRGVLVYLRQEGRGIGLLAKLHAYALQDAGADTVEANLRLGYSADAREYSAAVAILRDLGMDHVRLLTNNPTKVAALEAGGIACQRLSLQVAATPANVCYLRTKRDRLGHFLDLPDHALVVHHRATQEMPLPEAAEAYEMEAAHGRGL